MRKSFFAMNTYNTLTVYDNVPDEVLDDAVESISTLEKLWSVILIFLYIALTRIMPELRTTARYNGYELQR